MRRSFFACKKGRQNAPCHSENLVVVLVVILLVLLILIVVLVVVLCAVLCAVGTVVVLVLVFIVLIVIRHVKLLLFVFSYTNIISTTIRKYSFNL